MSARRGWGRRRWHPGATPAKEGGGSRETAGGFDAGDRALTPAHVFSSRRLGRCWRTSQTHRAVHTHSARSALRPRCLCGYRYLCTCVGTSTAAEDGVCTECSCARRPARAAAKRDRLAATAGTCAPPPSPVQPCETHDEQGHAAGSARLPGGFSGTSRRPSARERKHRRIG